MACFTYIPQTNGFNFRLLLEMQQRIRVKCFLLLWYHGIIPISCWRFCWDSFQRSRVALFILPTSSHTFKQENSCFSNHSIHKFQALTFSTLYPRDISVTFSCKTRSLQGTLSNHICWNHSISKFQVLHIVKPWHLPFIFNCASHLLFSSKHWDFL